MRILKKIKSRISKFFKKNDGLKLFRMHPEFERILDNTKVYGEYGVGDSTLFVADNYDIKILAVETDKKYYKKINDKIKIINSQSTIKYIDIGDIEQYGRPVNFEKRSNFSNYCESIWEQKIKPDTVFIDGRFRVSCFLFTLMASKKDTIIVFDDYPNRPIYHVVEEFIKPEYFFQRKAVFRVPDKNKLNLKKISTEYKNFLYVMN